MPRFQTKEVVTEEGYRLAPFLVRFASAAIDMAFFIASAALIFFLSTTNLFPTLSDALGVREAQVSLTDYQTASGLVTPDEKNVLRDISSTDYRDYEDAIYYYYTDYQSGNNPANPEPLNYTVMDYNTTVLGLPEDDEHINHSAYFDFVRIGGVAQLDQKGIINPDLYVDDKLPTNIEQSILSYFRDQYGKAQDHLMAQPYYKLAQKHLDRGLIIIEAIALYIPFLVWYVIIPMCSIPCATLGKRWMHLALADQKTAVALPKWRFALRSIPFVLTAMIGIILNDLVFSITTAVLVFLVSLGLAIFTKKRRALHDYLSASVVIRDDDLLVEVIKKEDAQDR